MGSLYILDPVEFVFLDHLNSLERDLCCGKSLDFADVNSNPAEAEVPLKPFAQGRWEVKQAHAHKT